MRHATTRTATLKAQQAKAFKHGMLLVHPPRGLFTVWAIRPVKILATR